MGSSYHQFCPVAKAMELLDERWTLLVVRELVTGSQHFNQLRRGLPRMSPTLLSKRLHQLTQAGVVQRQVEGSEVRYVLTSAGRELRPVVEALGAWGIRWIGELGDADLDPKLLLWDMHRNIDHTAVPSGRTVLQFRFPDVPGLARDWWLLIDQTDADVCDDDPGLPVTLTVTAGLRALIEVWRGIGAGPTPWVTARSSCTGRSRFAAPYQPGSPCPHSPPYPARPLLPSAAPRSGGGDPPGSLGARTDADQPMGLPCRASGHAYRGRRGGRAAGGNPSSPPVSGRDPSMTDSRARTWAVKAARPAAVAA